MKIPSSLLLLTMAVPAGAQSHVYDIVASPPSDAGSFGHAVAGIGDANGDGLPDFAVGAPDFFHVGGDAQGSVGSVSVHAGITGDRLFTVEGLQDLGAYGASVAGIGDVNGDGRDDIVVGSPSFDGVVTNGGRVQVLSGFDGSILMTINAPIPLTEGKFGERVAGGGDVDRDGVPDFLVTQHQANQGAVSVLSGATWELIYRFVGNPGESLQDVANAGLVNADGHAEVLVGGKGMARLMDGATGSVIYEWTWTSPSTYSATRVAGGGDLDGDGVPDLLVTDPYGGTNNEGFVRAYSGADGTLIRQWNGTQSNQYFGWAVSFAEGDVDGDGEPDVLAGSAGTSQGGIWLLSGQSASVYHPPGLNVGWTLAALGDVTGDDRPEFVIGGFVPYDFGQVACVTFSDPGPGTPVCFGDGSLADCPCSLSTPIFHEDFEGGVLPAGWSANGAWDLTMNTCGATCLGGGTAGVSGWFMYHGDDSTCDFMNSTGSGSLKSPLLTLPETHGGNLELQFKQHLHQDSEVHRAYLRVLDADGDVLESELYTPYQCENPTSFDLNHYKGATIRFEWLFTNDWFGSWNLGWQVDDVAVVWVNNNTQPGRGCRNSTGSGGVLLVTGSTSAAADDLVLTAAQVPPGQSGIFFVGDTFFDPPFTIGNGLSCTGGTNFRYTPVNTGSGSVDLVQPVASSLGTIQAGGTHQFQFWFRDTSPEALCPTGSNLTHGYRVTFAP